MVRKGIGLTRSVRLRNAYQNYAYQKPEDALSGVKIWRLFQ
ncbi:hypothetical protein ABIC63_004354 [Pseudacidovorax sp. 1753]